MGTPGSHRKSRQRLLGREQHALLGGSYFVVNLMVTCKSVQVVELLRTYRPYSREGRPSHDQAIQPGDVILWHSRGIHIVGSIGSLQGLNRSVKRIASMLLILLTLLYYVYLRPMIISTPEPELILNIVVQAIKLHWTPGSLVHFFA